MDCDSDCYLDFAFDCTTQLYLFRDCIFHLDSEAQIL